MNLYDIVTIASYSFLTFKSSDKFRNFLKQGDLKNIPGLCSHMITNIDHLVHNDHYNFFLSM